MSTRHPVLSLRRRVPNFLSDFLRDFESHQLGEGWLGVGRFVPHPQHLFLVWFGRGLGATEKVFAAEYLET